jgi:tetratricopeptide (TPR) repeat protein
MPPSVLRWAFACLLGTAVIAPVATANMTDPADDAPDLTKVRAAIDAKKYDAALADLKVLVVTYQQPDVYSLMGFALRKTGDRPQAMTYYRKALDLDPEHKGALEYQGELYVELGQIDKAKENLARLDHLCRSGCEEEDDLKADIEHATHSK